MVVLRDVADLCAGLHFREHRYVRSKGVVASIAFSPAPVAGDDDGEAEEEGGAEAESYWEQLPPMHGEEGLSEGGGNDDLVDRALVALDGWSQARWAVEVRSVNARDVMQTFHVTAGRLYEGLPVDIPKSYLRERGSSSGVGGLPAPLEGLAACFASGLEDEHEVSRGGDRMLSVEWLGRGILLYSFLISSVAVLFSFDVSLALTFATLNAPILSFFLSFLPFSSLYTYIYICMPLLLCPACWQTDTRRNAYGGRKSCRRGVRGQDRDVFGRNLPREPC